jgi:ATP-dependent DNA ligase
MAVHIENHPISYASFEGSIPKGQYGAGKVIVRDWGLWEALENSMRAHLYELKKGRTFLTPDTVMVSTTLHSQ